MDECSAYAAFRKPTAWIKADFGFWPKTKITTHESIEDDLFSAIDYIAEIEDVGLKRFESLGKNKAKKTYETFRSFVRQSKNFYFAAKELHYRSSALLYYYSFLNLVKAYLTFTTCNIFDQRIYHGLEYRSLSGDLSLQNIRLHKSGIYPLFYESLYNIKIEKSHLLNIVTLLGYCYDIQHEYETAGYGNIKQCLSRVVSLSNSRQRFSWLFIAVHNFNVIKPHKKTLKKFNKYYEQVVPEAKFLYEVLDIPASSADLLTYFQSKNAYTWDENNSIRLADIKSDFQDCVRLIYDPILYDEDWDFMLSSPFRPNFQMPFNQALAIYALFFYFGSLVRYNPRYLDCLFSSKDSWLIERFIKSSPQTFLRYIVCALYDRNYIFKLG